MKIYRTAYIRPDGEHAGFRYFVWHKDARNEAKKYAVNGYSAKVEKLTYKGPSGRIGVVEMFNRYASHPDNG